MEIDEKVLLRLGKLVHSEYKVKRRICELKTGDIVFAPITLYPLYVNVTDNSIKMYIIVDYLTIKPRVDKSESHSYEFGLKNQMWVIKKLLKPIKSNYQ